MLEPPFVSCLPAGLFGHCQKERSKEHARKFGCNSGSFWLRNIYIYIYMYIAHIITFSSTCLYLYYVFYSNIFQKSLPPTILSQHVWVLKVHSVLHKHLSDPIRTTNGKNWPPRLGQTSSSRSCMACRLPCWAPSFASWSSYTFFFFSNAIACRLAWGWAYGRPEAERGHRHIQP